MSKIIYILPLAFFLFCGNLNSQDMQFSQYYAAPLYLNPAFSGANVCARLSSTIRNQWPSIPGGYVSELVSFDHYLQAQNIGVGVLFANDRAGSGKLKQTSFSALLAYELAISRKFAMRFGFQAGGGMRSINFNDLIFGDQIARGGNVSTVEALPISKAFVDFSTGVLAYSKNYWLGIALHHITKPNESLQSDESKLPTKFSLHGGYKLKIKGEEDMPNGAHYLSPTFNFRSQGKFDQLDIGAYYNYHIFNLGLWYRGIPLFKSYARGYPNNDALVFLVGLKIDRLQIGYSYDWTISWLRGSTFGAHEVSFTYQFCKFRKRKSRPIVQCPKF